MDKSDHARIEAGFVQDYWQEHADYLLPREEFVSLMIGRHGWDGQDTEEGRRQVVERWRFVHDRGPIESLEMYLRRRWARWREFNDPAVAAERAEERAMMDAIYDAGMREWEAQRRPVIGLGDVAVIDMRALDGDRYDVQRIPLVRRGRKRG